MRIALRKHGKFDWDKMAHLGVETTTAPSKFLIEVGNISTKTLGTCNCLEDVEKLLENKFFIRRIYGYVHGGPPVFETYQRCPYGSALYGYVVMSMEEANAKFGNELEYQFDQDVKMVLDNMNLHMHR